MCPSFWIWVQIWKPVSLSYEDMLESRRVRSWVERETHTIQLLRWLGFYLDTWIPKWSPVRCSGSSPGAQLKPDVIELLLDSLWFTRITFSCPEVRWNWNDACANISAASISYYFQILSWHVRCIESCRFWNGLIQFSKSEVELHVCQVCFTR